MRNLMRNLTLSAAALAALVSIAPTADAQYRGAGRGNESPRQEFRERGRGEFRGREFREREFREREFRGAGFRGRAFFPAPVRVFGRRYVSPFRVFAGRRFYSYCPGPGYVYIADYGWGLPPFLGAVWIPGYTDIDGFRVEGYWR
jgi:hypothetical protein